MLVSDHRDLDQARPVLVAIEVQVHVGLVEPDRTGEPVLGFLVRTGRYDVQVCDPGVPVNACIKKRPVQMDKPLCLVDLGAVNPMNIYD